jgi:cytochrome c peroxidase
MKKSTFVLAIFLLSFGISGLVKQGSSAIGQGSRVEQGSLRRPVALVLVDEGKTLLVANRNGTVSVLDIAAGRVAAEEKVGRRLADLTATPDGRWLLAADEEANELVVLERSDGAPKVARRVAIGKAPVRVRIGADGKRAFIASLWARCLTLLDLEKTQTKVAKVLDLPFPPRELLVVEDKVIVTDSFGGRLAVVDIGRQTVESVRSFPGHNVRGLARHGNDVLLAHQVLQSQAHATRDDVHWGNLLTNVVRAIPLATVLDPKADLLKGSRLYQLGDVGAGAADPAGLAVRPDGGWLVSLGGVNEIALGSGKEANGKRVRVGQRPTALVLAPDGRRTYVANTFADSISVVDLQSGKSTEISLGDKATATALERGEQLFFDARLSHDRWMSCHSCHTDGHTNGLLADTLGDGTYGTPKRVLSLRGGKDTAPYAWNGSMPDLKSQIRKSIATTMHGRKPTDEEIADLEAYLRSLPPPPPLPSSDARAVQRGQALFDKQGCAICHVPPTYTSTKTYDVGLADEAGVRTFNPPSLRGVGQGGPYFHDGRATTLEDVVGRFKHQVKGELTRGEVADLAAFLRSI